MKHLTCADIRTEFRALLDSATFVKDKSGVDLIEIAGQSFIADEPSLFGKVSEEYVARELEWYKSQSLNVNDIPAPVPKIWKAVATPDGRINSNYGHLIWSVANYAQYSSCLLQLVKDQASRRAIMIYTRPSMQAEYNQNGMSDFICTNAVQYMVRDGRLNAYVQMRSSDAVFGYKNDRAWHQYVLETLATDLAKHTASVVIPGNIYWSATSLHVYARHFDLVLAHEP